MVYSPNFQSSDGTDTLSANQLRQVHNLVETAKEFVREGKTSHGRCFHCCFVLKHGKVKAVGFNSYKYRIDRIRDYGLVKKYTDGHYHMALHAELNAILKLGKTDYGKMTFLNVHIDKNGKCKASKPCLNCHRMMEIVGVKNCIYFDEENKKWLELRF